MKKIILLIILLMFPFQIFAYSADCMIVMDMDSGRVFYANDIYKKRLIASTTKIMTAILAIESGKLEEVVTVNDSVLKAYGSGIYLSVGEHITLKDIVYGLMLRSGNDAALMIASFLAGNEEKFAELMQQKAAELNMKDSVFVNASGLDEKGGNYSTCYDMALLMSYAMKNEIFREITGTKRHVVKTDMKTYDWYNKNKVLTMYQYATGGKTGFTEKARRTLVTSASKDGLELVVVTLNDPNDFSDHINAFENVYSTYERYLIVDKDRFSVPEDTYYKNNLYIEENVYYPLKENEKELLSTNVKLEKKPFYQNGDKVGTLEIYLDELKIGEVTIRVKKETIIKPGKRFLDYLLEWFRLW